METLPLLATILVATILLFALYRTTRHRRPQWGVCSACNYRLIWIHGVDEWLHVTGEYGAPSEPHEPIVRPGSVHLRRT